MRENFSASLNSSGSGGPGGGLPGWSNADLGAFGLIAVVVAVVFGQTIGFQFVPYDDPAYITGNSYVTGGLTLRGLLWAFTYWETGGQLAHPGVENLWHPLTWISHMLDAQIFGIRIPGGHHFTNIVLHGGTAWLVYLFAGRLTASRVAGLVAALLFAIHPLRVESVAWVSERKDVLSGLLFFWSLLLILRDRRGPALFVFLGAMMAKPSTVVLPVAAILALGWRDGERSWGWKFWWDRLVEWRWWFVAALATALLAIWFQDQGTHAPLMESLPFGYRLRHLAGGILFTVWRSIVPVGLSFHYEYPAYSTKVAAGAWALLLGIGTLVWMRRRQNPGTFFAVAWFLICSLPSSGLLYVGTSFTADRYTYLSLTGAFAMFGLWVAGGKYFRARLFLAGALIVVLALVSHRQCAVWRNGWTLFSHAETVQPENPVVLINLGAMHQQDGRHAEAKEMFRRVLRVAPRDSRAWFNLGNSLRDTGETGEAVEAFRQAVEIDPRYANAWRNLGLILCDEANPNRRPQEARDAFAQASDLTSRKDPVPLLMQAELEFDLGNIPATKSLLGELQTLQSADPRIDSRMHALRRKLP